MASRLTIATLTGAVLGIFCIVGMGLRFGYEGNILLLSSAWVNRILMGIVIGLAGEVKALGRPLVRGALLGGFVSGCWFLSTGLQDPVGFAAGIPYGIVIDLLATRYSR